MGLNRGLFSITLCLGVVALAPARAQVYKWVDSNGKVQYSDSAPADKKVGVVKSVPAASAGTTTVDWQERDRDFRRRKMLNDEKARKDEEEEDKMREKRRRECAEAHEWIDDLNSGKRIYRINPATGDRVYMGEADRAAKMKEARQSIAENCRG